jgi:diguanylate cyclase
VGSILQGALRTGDFVGRNGGEEFAMLLPDTGPASGFEIAERIRLSIADLTVPGTDVSVTASLGVAGYPEHANSSERLERLADAALYVAKRQGRDRTEVADPTHDFASTDVDVTRNGTGPAVIPSGDSPVRQRSIA